MTRRQKKTLYRILAALVLWILCRFLPYGGRWWRLAAYLVPYAICGWDVVWSAARNLVSGQVFDEKLLMTVATAGAFALEEYPEAVAVMLFYQVGELFQSIAVGRSRRSISALMSIRPDTATVVRGGAEVAVSPEEVAVGETIVIRPGERVPLDGVILNGETSVDTSALTGESMPADKKPGDRILSGTINLTGAVYAQTDSAFEQSTVSRILELVENASSRKSRAENFITRFARWYTPSVAAGAVLIALLPPLAFGAPFARWFRSALVFLMVSCPCALVVSVPLGFFGGLGAASREGILIKGSNYLEALSKVNVAAFDKTGTLTQGRFAVAGVYPEGISREALISLAAAAESRSSHPIAQSILALRGQIAEDAGGTNAANHTAEAVSDSPTILAGNRRMTDEADAPLPNADDPARATQITERAGYGVEAAWDGYRILAGNRRMTDEADAPLPNADDPARATQITERAGYGVEAAWDGYRILAGNQRMTDEADAPLPNADDPARETQITERAGYGVEAAWDGRRILAGNRRMMEEAGVSVPPADGTAVFVAEGTRYLGRIEIEDQLKPDAKEAVLSLKKQGVLRTVLLTGDSPYAAERVKNALGIDEARASLLPADKVSSVEALKGPGKTVMFVGDGINDAPVIALADVGVAMGALGSDAAIEAADVVLMDDKPASLPRAVKIARKTMRIVRQNIAFSLLVKAAILLLSAFGASDLRLAVVADVGVLIAATANALRALKA